MVSFIEENDDFVLKLKVTKKCGETQIRRVYLPRIAEKGTVSYQKLIGLVLEFALGEVGATSDADKYAVSLTYIDDEKDVITLASTDDLIDAINLFSKQNPPQKFIRITTSVKLQVDRETSANDELLSSSSGGCKIHASPPCQGFSKANTSKGGTENTLKPPIQEVLNSLANIITNSAKELKGLASITANASNDHDGSFKSNDTKAKGHEKSKVGRNTNGGVNATTGTPASSRSGTVTTNEKTRKKTTPILAAATAANVKKGVKTKSEDDSTKAVSKEKETPFIHGRHTCDSCLTTPIVGKRYHAANLRDYDLCSNCFENHSGSEIKFIGAQLERDVPMQLRWRRRYQRQLMLTKIHQRRREVACKGKNKPKFHNPAGRDPAALGEEQYEENALKEAIRRSLDDIFPEKSSSMKTDEFKQEKKKVEEEDSPKTSSKCEPKRDSSEKDSNGDSPSFESIQDGEGIRRSHDDTSPKKSSSMKSGEFKQEKGEVEKEDSPKTSSKCEPKCDTSEKNISGDSSSLESVQDEEPILRSHDDTSEKKSSNMKIDKFKQEKATVEEEDSPKTLSNCEPKCDTSEKDNKGNSTSFKSVQNEAPITNTSLDVNDDQRNEVDRTGKDIPSSVEIANCEELISKNVEMMETTMMEETDSVDSEKLLSENMSIPAPKSKAFTNFKDESFSSDAAGNGEVAEIIGKTLDKVGGVISEMLSENANEITNDIETEELDAVAAVKNEESSNENGYGELIMNSNDGEENDDSNTLSSDSQWSVVDSVGTTESEQIRQATQFVGSLLFNSDIKTSSEDGVSDLVGSNTSFSLPGSVPSDVRSLNSRMTDHGRWEKELEKLRELGFENNSTTILVLEKVQEMSGAESELDFDKVVNELLDTNA